MKTDKEDIQKDSGAVSERRLPTKEPELRQSDAEIRFGDIGEEEVEDEPVDQTGAGDMPGGNKKAKQILSDEDLERAARVDDARSQVRDLGHFKLGTMDGARSAEPKTYPEIMALELSALLEHTRIAERGFGLTSREELLLCRRYIRAVEKLEQGQWRELPASVDPSDLAAAGWGVIFADADAPAIRAQLRPLLEHRKNQAGALCREIIHYPQESAGVFLLHRHGETPGVFNPRKLPYYLLIAGNPESIPFEFQYQLSISHAVGRIAFDNTADYGRYARAVVTAETEDIHRPRRASFFSVEGDWETDLLARHLVEPLEKEWPNLTGDWEIETLRRSKASTSNLSRLLSTDGPVCIFVSCHGESLVAGDSDQRLYQGALRCHDGRYSGSDIQREARLTGQIVFLFACYGAGTPVRNNFPHSSKSGTPDILAKEPFVAHLPQTLLRQGALACIGHVDRGWTTSFAWVVGNEEIPTVSSFKDMLFQLFRQRQRLGHAMRPLARRYTALAAMLALEIEHQSHSERECADKDARQIAFQWTAHNDARNFIILGDPAVYMPPRQDR